MKNKIIKYIIIVISLIAVLGIVLALAFKKDKTNNNKDNDLKEPIYKQCSEATDREKELSNWTHNSLNYDIDENGNRINNSTLVKEKHDLGNGIILSNMEIISENCKEVKANIKVKFTNNTGKDITFGSLKFKFKSSESSSEVIATLDVKNVKNGETVPLETSYRVRIIDALNYSAEFVDSSQMEG